MTKQKSRAGYEAGFAKLIAEKPHLVPQVAGLFGMTEARVKNIAAGYRTMGISRWRFLFACLANAGELRKE